MWPTRRTSRLLLALAIVASATARAQAPKRGAVDVARAYLGAMDRSDLDAAGELFAKRSSIFESGGTEGDWAHYREHHIGPELGEIVSFETTLGEPEEEKSLDGSMAFVAWPIEYKIELKDGRVIDSRGTVTFVLAREQDAYRIRHMHWSSRKKKPKK